MKWVRNVVDQSSRLPPFLCSGRNVPSFEAHALSYPGAYEVRYASYAGIRFHV